VICASAARLPYPTSIAIDDSYVYWTNTGDGSAGGEIKKVAK
jgi:hypothetical protein